MATYIVDYSTVEKRSKLKINADLKQSAWEKAAEYLEKKYKGFRINGIEQEKTEEGLVFDHLWERLADYVIREDSCRYNCESEGEASELAEQVKAEFHRLGQEENFDAWVFGTEVHVFPVFYQMVGSLNYLERKEREAQDKPQSFRN
ncbi:hypothetical protein KJ966_24700 [bacterium]|nr:hypothetical protein [bacterium]